MVNLSIVRVKQSIFQKEGTYVDKKTGETKKSKGKWVAEVSYVESSYSKLLGQNILRERTDEFDCECELIPGSDWLVETKIAYEKTVIIRVIGKADFNLLLPGKQAKGEKS